MKKYGFTLIEILIVIAIIGVLGAIITPSLVKSRARARDTVRITDMKQMELALDQFFRAKGHYPGTEEGITGGWSVVFGGERPTDEAFSVAMKDFVRHLPTDPKYSGSAGKDDFFYSYDPNHYVNGDPSAGCLGGGKPGATIAVNRFENPGDERIIKDTYVGGDAHQCTAHFVKAFFPSAQ